MKTIQSIKKYTDVQCRYAHKGCQKKPIGVFHTPFGCHFEEDPVMALCEDHYPWAVETGPVELIVPLPGVYDSEYSIKE